MLLEQLSLISIEKLMNSMDLGGFLVFLGQGAWQPVPACGALWQPVAPCGGLWKPIGCPYIKSLEPSMPGGLRLRCPDATLAGWLAWLAGWLGWLGWLAWLAGLAGWLQLAGCCWLAAAG